jgi:hypothetical protein
MRLQEVKARLVGSRDLDDLIRRLSPEAINALGRRRRGTEIRGTVPTFDAGDLYKVGDCWEVISWDASRVLGIIYCWGTDSWQLTVQPRYAPVRVR